jgi:DMSO/TMAO reductase YedYZ molybdopterin-dependent catalytic subunit
MTLLKRPLRIALTRRKLVGSLGAGAGGLLLSGCDRITASPTVQHVLGVGEKLTMGSQRLLSSRTTLAPEFSALDMSPVFRTNGNTDPASDAYARHAAEGFAHWQLAVDGLVRRPLSLSLAQIRAMPARTQITRHDCVEGWSAIGKWTGMPLKLALDAAGVLASARYVVFHCADDFAGDPYYESIDLIDAYHPQTILAWGMNDQLLSIGHGAPLRLRVERQLGYKQAKYVMRVELVDSLAGIGGGKGGYWEDAAGYQWYAGI